MEGIDPSNFYQFGSLAGQFLANIEETLPSHPFFQGKPYALDCCQGALKTLADGIKPLFGGNAEVVEKLPQESAQFLLRLIRGQIIKLPTDFSPHPLRTTDFLAVQAILSRELGTIEHHLQHELRKKSTKKKGKGAPEAT